MGTGNARIIAVQDYCNTCMVAAIALLYIPAYGHARLQNARYIPQFHAGCPHGTNSFLVDDAIQVCRANYPMAIHTLLRVERRHAHVLGYLMWLSEQQTNRDRKNKSSMCVVKTPKISG